MTKILEAKNIIKIILAIVAIVACLQFVMFYTSSLKKANSAIPPSLQENEYKFQPDDLWLLLQLPGIFMQITILLLGGLWSFLIAKRSIFFKLQNWHLWFVFAMPNVSFIFTSLLYGRILSRFQASLYNWGYVSLNPKSNYIWLLPESQEKFFFYGIIASAFLIIVSLCYDKQRGSND